MSVMCDLDLYVCGNTLVNSIFLLFFFLRILLLLFSVFEKKKNTLFSLWSVSEAQKRFSWFKKPLHVITDSRLRAVWDLSWNSHRMWSLAYIREVLNSLYRLYIYTYKLLARYYIRLSLSLEFNYKRTYIFELRTLKKSILIICVFEFNNYYSF